MRQRCHRIIQILFLPIAQRLGLAQRRVLFFVEFRQRVSSALRRIHLVGQRRHLLVVGVQFLLQIRDAHLRGGQFISVPLRLHRRQPLHAPALLARMIRRELGGVILQERIRLLV